MTMNAQQMQMLRSGKMPSGMSRKLRRRGIDISAMTNGVSSITEDMKLARMSPKSVMRYKLNKLRRGRKSKTCQNELANRHQVKEEEAHRLVVEQAAIKRKSDARKRKKWNSKLNRLEREIGKVTIEQYTNAQQLNEKNARAKQLIALYERQQNSNSAIADLYLDDLV